MNACDELRHEHKVVLLVLSGAGELASGLRAGEDAARATTSEAVEFFQNFVDRCHHTKEERHLFPALVAGAGAEGPVSVMLSEHAAGRELVRGLAGSLGRGELEAAADNLLAYRDLLVAHIGKEDGVLFPLADRSLPAGEQQRLADAFALVEAEEMGEGVHERYHKLAHRLAKHLVE